MNKLNHLKRFNESDENLNISDVMESKKSGVKSEEATGTDRILPMF